MKQASYFLFVLFALIPQLLSAQISPQQAIEEMGRGINLGNTLEPPTEGAWNNGPAQESHFDAYEEAGFTNIRIPVRWDEHTGDASPFDVVDSWMDRVEEVVDWGLERGFYITLNGHHEDWLKNNYTNSILRDRYDAIWEQIAERFKDKSDKLLFEIINEPNGMTVAQVDDLNERILGIIRETNPTRLVIFGGNMYANAEQLLDAKILDDEYVIGYYHSYDPWSFSGLGNGTWGTDFDYQQVTNKYNLVKNWSTTNNIPVHHSEFGAIHACDYNSRMRIYAHNVEQCIVNGFAFSVWDDGGNFGILNRSNDTWPEVKDILMHYHEDSPNAIFSSVSTNPDTEEVAVLVEWNNRVTSTADIILERSVGVSNNFQEIAVLDSDATSYLDTDVTSGLTYTYRMYTEREDGTLLHGYPTRITVTTGTSSDQSPFSGSPILIPGTLEVEEYDTGGQDVAYNDNETANMPGDFRPDEGVDIGAYNGGFIIGYVHQGEWLEYTVNVQQAGTYSVKAEVASEIPNGAFNIVFEKNNATFEFDSPGTGGWVEFVEITNNNGFISLEEGEQIVRFSIVNNNAFNINRLVFNLETTNVEDLEEKANQIKIYPNPAHGNVNFELEEELFQPNMILEIYKITGEKVSTLEITNKITNVNVDHFANGNYLIKIIGTDFTVQKKLVVNK